MDLSQIITSPSLTSLLPALTSTKSTCLSLLSTLSSLPPTTQTSPTADFDPTQPPPFPPDPTALAAKSSLHASLSHLRGLNRSTIHAIRETKSLTASAKVEVDTLHLHLQNLLYEQSHLVSSIRACEGYEHTYTSLPLVSREEFLSLHPELEAKLENGEGEVGEHEVTIARIEHEYREREGLEGRRQELLRRKAELVKDNKKRREDLASLDVDLERFVEAAGPIQRIFEKEY